MRTCSRGTAMPILLLLLLGTAPARTQPSCLHFPDLLPAKLRELRVKFEEIKDYFQSKDDDLSIQLLSSDLLEEFKVRIAFPREFLLLPHPSPAFHKRGSQLETGACAAVTPGWLCHPAGTRVAAAGLALLPPQPARLPRPALVCTNAHTPCWWPSPTRLPPPVAPGEPRLPVGVRDDGVLHGGGAAQRNEDQHAPPAERGRPGQPPAEPQDHDEALSQILHLRGQEQEHEAHQGDLH
uniref:Interleukin family protein n=1 Tax=Corvus moneduloides TaxID=1196302 RepID=A0A8U7NKB3_CORMO